MSETHSSHSLKPLQLMAHQERVTIESLSEHLLNSILEPRIKLLKDCQDRHFEITALLERETEKIESVFESLKRQLDCQKERLVKELQNVGEKKIKTMEKLVVDLEENCKSIQHSCDVAKRVVHETSDIDLLAINTTISSRLKELERFSCDPPKREEFGVDFDFVQELEFVESFGRIFDLKGISLKGLTVSGNGINPKVQTGTEMSFTLTFKDMTNLQLVEDIKVEAVFEGPGQVDPVVINNMDGTFSVNYLIDIPGSYSIYVFVESNLIEQSPFIVQTCSFEHRTLTWKHIKTTGSEGSSNAQFKHAIGAAIHPIDGRIFVTDERNHRVQIFDNSGNFLSSFGSFGSGPTNLSDPMGIVMIPSKNALVITEYNACRIHVFDENGTNLHTFGSKGNAVGQFMNPWGITTDQDEKIYICDFNNHRIQVFDFTGRSLLTFGSKGSAAGLLNNPSSIAVCRKGNMYVTDRSNHRVQIFDRSGKFIRSFGSLGSSQGSFNTPHGIALDCDGNIIVCDCVNNRIQIFDESGVFIRAVGTKGTGVLQFSHPIGISVTRSGRVVVCEHANHRIQIFDLKNA